MDKLSHQICGIACVVFSCHMEGRLFGRTETEKQQQELIKAKTLLACETERAKLKRCFRESWFGWCIEEHRQFWDCFLRVGLLYLYILISSRLLWLVMMFTGQELTNGS